MIELDFEKLTWSSDASGDEAGYPDVLVVGYYSYQPNVGPEIMFEIDMDNGVILDMWASCDCD